jgi:kynurenine formamidase
MSQSGGMRWKKKPEGSNWGDFGPDDELGSLNYIGPDAVKRGIKEVTSGERFCLSLPLDYPGGTVLNPRRQPPALAATQRDGRPNFNFPMGRIRPGCVDVVCDDTATLSLQYSTQWDALAHIGAMFDADDDGIPEQLYYNGFRANEHVVGPISYGATSESDDRDTGLKNSNAKRLDVACLAQAAVQTRGVLVNLARRFGQEHRAVSYDDLMRCIDESRISVESGDILLLYTGFADAVLSMKKNPDPKRIHSICCGLDGSDARLLNWISDSKVAAIAADNYAVEFYPGLESNSCCTNLPLHHHCLFKLGLPLGELWYLRELANWLDENRRNYCLLTAPPLNLPGAVGSPVTPVATV